MQGAVNHKTSTLRRCHLSIYSWLGFISLVFVATGPIKTLSVSAPPFQLQHIDHIVLNYRGDMTEMFDFYTKTLGCTVDSPDDIGRMNGKLTHLRAGPNTMIDLMQQDDENGECSSVTAAVDHFCLRIDPYDEKKLEDYLTKQGVVIQSAGMRKGAQGVGPSIYIQDPVGNSIELKGPPTEARPQEKKTETTANDATATTKIVENDQNDQPREEACAAIVGVPVTPCTRICRYNADFFDGQVCIGCYRETFEIGTWESMSASQKYMALLDAIDRWKDSATAELDGSISLDDLKRQAEYWKVLSTS